MGKIEEDLRGLQWDFLKTLQPNSLSKFISLLHDSNSEYNWIYIRIGHTCLSQSIVSKVNKDLKDKSSVQKPARSEKKSNSHI